MIFRRGRVARAASSRLLLSSMPPSNGRGSIRWESLVACVETQLGACGQGARRPSTTPKFWGFVAVALRRASPMIGESKTKTAMHEIRRFLFGVIVCWPRAMVPTPTALKHVRRSCCLDDRLLGVSFLTSTSWKSAFCTMYSNGPLIGVQALISRYLNALLPGIGDVLLSKSA